MVFTNPSSLPNFVRASFADAGVFGSFCAYSAFRVLSAIVQCEG